MAKKRVRKADKKKAKEKKQSTEKAINARFNEMMKEKGYNIASDAQLTEEQRQLLIDFPGKKPRPHKVKTKYSGRVPPIPPPPLLDLIHNFLKDFKYIKAAHGVRTDNQKRPGHNMDVWKWTSEGLPDLLEMFNQWWREHPNIRPIVNPEDPVGHRRRTKDGEILPGAPTILGEAPKGHQSSDKNGDLRPASPSGNEVDSDEDIAGGMDIDLDAPQASAKPITGSKRKAAEMSSSSSSSSVSDTSDEESGSSSASDSSSGSESEPEASTKHASATKKIKLESGLALPSATAKSKKAERPVSSATASESSSSSASSSSSSSGSSSGSRRKSQGREKPSSKSKAARSDSDSDSSSSSEASPDEVDKVDSRAKKNLNGTKKYEGTNGVRASHSSDTSATIPAPVDSNQNQTEDKKVIASVSNSSPSSSSGSDSDSESESDKNTRSKSKNTSKGRTTVVAKPEISNIDNITEGTISNRTTIKGQNTPFSRIPSNLKVEDRFSSNAYRSYDYAERAHQDLIKTKGKGFTKEKNKKKRGSYRGGVIDISGGKGIKFDD